VKSKVKNGNILMVFLYLFLFLSSHGITTRSTVCSSNENNQVLLIQSFQHVIQSNGCPESSDSFHGHHYTICCDQQQLCYQVCGLTKNYCDEDLKFCLSQLCENIQGVDESHICESNLNLLFTSLVYSNYEDYEDSQTMACQCVEDIQMVDSEYLNFFQRFYLKYAPEKFSKGMIVIQREIQKSQENLLTYRKLFYELHKKYDNAIAYTERRSSCTSYPRLGESWSLREKD
jgi:hypothetical protein